jgi:nicotinate-nucleotide adenylyltransferase
VIGIMGGTFDPIHYGHLRSALEAAEALSLQKVLFIPTHTPLLKQQPICTEQDRLMMIKLAINDTPFFQLDEREITRKGCSYTIDTLKALRIDYPEEQFAFLLGADAFANFKQWKDWRAIMEHVHLAVLHRPDYPLDSSDWESWQWAMDSCLLDDTVSGRIFPLPVTPLSISSTFIRRQLSQQKTVRFLLPENVLSYIVDRNLYRCTPC